MLGFYHNRIWKEVGEKRRGGEERRGEGRGGKEMNFSIGFKLNVMSSHSVA